MTKKYWQQWRPFQHMQINNLDGREHAKKVSEKQLLSRVVGKETLTLNIVGSSYDPSHKSIG